MHPLKSEYDLCKVKPKLKQSWNAERGQTTSWSTSYPSSNAPYSLQVGALSLSEKQQISKRNETGKEPEQVNIYL